MSNGNGWLSLYSPQFLNQCNTSGYVFLPQPTIPMSAMTTFESNIEHLKGSFRQYFDELTACDLDLRSTMVQFIRNLKQSLIHSQTNYQFHNIEILEAAISFGDNALLEEVVNVIGSISSAELIMMLSQRWAWECDTSIFLRILSENRVSYIYLNTYMEMIIQHAFEYKQTHVLVELLKRIDWLTANNLLTCVRQNSVLSSKDKATHVIDDLFVAKFQGWSQVAILNYIEAMSHYEIFWHNSIFSEWGLDNSVKLHENHRVAHALSPWLQSGGDNAVHVNQTRVAITKTGIEHCKKIIADCTSLFDILSTKKNYIYVFNVIGWPVDAPVFRDMIDFLLTTQSIYESPRELPDIFSDILDNLPVQEWDELNRLYITYKAVEFKDEALVQKAVAKMNITSDELASIESEYFYAKNKVWGITGGVLTMLATTGYGVKLVRDSEREAKRANERLPFEIALLSQLAGKHAIENGIPRFIPAPESSTAFPRRFPYEKPFAVSRFRQQEMAYAMGILAHLPNSLQEEVLSFLPGMQAFLQVQGKTRGNYYLDKAKELEANRGRDKPFTSTCTIL